MNNKVETKYSAFILCVIYFFVNYSKSPKKTLSHGKRERVEESTAKGRPILPSDPYVIRIIFHLNSLQKRSFGSNC